MENLRSSYETIFIVDLQVGDDEVKKTVEKFTSLITENGTINEIQDWGKRRLAYPINDLNDGYYTLVKFESAPDFPAELDRIYNITESIMRSITVKLETKKSRFAAKKPVAEVQQAVEETTAEAVEVDAVAAETASEEVTE